MAETVGRVFVFEVEERIQARFRSWVSILIIPLSEKLLLRHYLGTPPQLTLASSPRNHNGCVQLFSQIEALDTRSALSTHPQMPLIFATLSGSLQTQFSPSCRLSCFVHFSLVFLKLTCQRSRCSPFLPHCAFPESKNDILFNFLFPEPNAVKDTSVDTPLVATTKITQAVLLHWNLISKEMNERLSDTPWKWDVLEITLPGITLALS